NILSDSTPFRNNVRAQRMQPDPEEAKAEERYLKLADELDGHVQHVSFDDILHQIGLTDAFNQFSSKIGNSFDDLAAKSPSIHTGQYHSNDGSGAANLRETHVTEYFHKLYADMIKLCDALDKSVQREVIYELVDHQTKLVGGSKSKPDALSWTPTDRMPEGAIYEYLHTKKVVGIPQVYKSGIIVRELFGYRLEFILLEDCGSDLFKYMSTTCLKQHIEDLENTVINIVSVIDWGYAKLVATDTGDTNHIDALAERWGFSKDTVQATEDDRDANTGTPIYMGIRILSQCPQRGIMDDLESMFYVVLHILGCRESQKVIDFLGCTYLNNELAAKLKAFAMTSPDLYLRMAGIKHCPAKIKAALDKLHERLFFVDGKFIGPNLTLDDEEMTSKRGLDDAF
ncbi:hypothetical protein LPJ53_006431, partial [Coemansia erecta]